MFTIQDFFEDLHLLGGRELGQVVSRRKAGNAATENRELHFDL